MGALSLPSVRFARFGNLARPGVRTANFAALGTWSRVLSKNAESLRNSDALMRVAVPRHRGPAGLRDLFRFCRNRNLEVKSMMKLDNFINMMTGHFNNKEQFDNMQREGKTYPYAEHINTICNEKILNLPKDFNGKFVVEESYYETNGKRHASPHLFLITEKEDGIVLYSYEIPEGEDKSTFSYDSMKNADYTELKKSEKFTPALYHEKDGIWEGGSTSQFSPVMTFKLWEKFSDSCLEVSESMEVNGKKTFGYDEPIIYKRV